MSEDGIVPSPYDEFMPSGNVKGENVVGIIPAFKRHMKSGLHGHIIKKTAKHSLNKNDINSIKTMFEEL